ncbi:MAG TPA: hypothetical protein PL180_21835, partial [Spirochaetota bacterium]|nr:hypothetical protein [Spirochaetota bacterium]
PYTVSVGKATMPPDFMTDAAFRITPREGWDIRIGPAAGPANRELRRFAKSFRDISLIMTYHTTSDCIITRKIFDGT